MQARYIASMIGLALVDLGFTGAYVVMSGHVDAVPQALATSFGLLVVVNALGSWFLFAPIARCVRPGETVTPLALDRAAQRLKSLPRLSSLWHFALGITYSLVMFLSGVFTPPDGTPGAVPVPDMPVLIGALIWFTTAYAYYFGFYGFFAATDIASRSRRRLFDLHDFNVPAQSGSLLPKLTVVVLTLTVMPAAIILLDLTVFSEIRALQGLTPEKAVMLDIMALLTAAAISLIFIGRGLTMPVSCLMEAIERVSTGDLKTPAPALANDEIGHLTNRFNTMLDGLREREHIRNTFGKFVAPAVADRILRDGDASDGHLAGEMRTSTIMFTDIEGFTGLSERISPDQMIDMLNVYFDLICTPIHQSGGTITNFIGDAVHAVYNVPDTDPEHAQNAIRAALQIQDVLERATFPAGITLNTRIGIHTGPVVAGTVGGRDRLGYTVYGDAVNLAARLEPLNKEFGTRILMSEATAALAWDMQAEYGKFTNLGEVQVRGRTAAVSVFTIERANQNVVPLEQLVDRPRPTIVDLG